MTGLITDHVWRPYSAGTGSTTKLRRAKGPVLERPCEYMNCRRPRSEHERAVNPNGQGRSSK